MTEPIKENKCINQAARTAIKKSSPAFSIKQKPHVVPEENDTLNVPNLDKQITQPKPHL